MEIIERIKKLCENKKLQLTDHAIKRFTERNIDIVEDIVPAIMSGEIIETYPDDYPFISYLVLGVTLKQKAIHIVCAVGDDVLWIITAYFPDIIKWENDFKTRKKVL